MSFDFTRRGAIASFSSLLLTGCLPRDHFSDDMRVLEQQYNAQIGVSAIHISTGKVLSFNGNNAFAMCSTFKWLLVGLILKKVDMGDLSLAEKLSIKAEDIVFHSPITEKYLGEGSISVKALCEAAIKVSDNTAANLLLGLIGGPQGFTDTMQQLGDSATRLDRWEPYLNENALGDLRDTTTPNAMTQHMKHILFGDYLSNTSRAFLRETMINARVGLDRLRAGVPSNWVIGNKTGTSSNRATNDVAFALPNHGNEQDGVVIASYVNLPEPLLAENNKIHAEIAKSVVGSIF